MKNVANKKLIRTLSYRTMKEKKWKNLIAVLAIGLTSLMFTAMFTVGASLINSMQEATMRQVGTSAHGGYKYMTQKEYEKVKAAGGYKDISYDIIAGSGANPELNMIQTEVRFAEDKMAKWGYSYPETGKMPKTAEECAASSKVLEALGIPMELGAKVPIQVRTMDGDGNDKIIECNFTLAGFWQSNDASMAQQFYVSRDWMEENIVLPDENYNSLLREGKPAPITGTMQVNIWFQSSLNIEGQMKELTKRAGFHPEDVSESVNWAYAGSSLDFTSISIGVVMLFIIMLSGYLIIYNIFYINVTSDIHYYGLLKTIGTTGRQLRKMVRGQALLLSLAGIPLGLLGGWFVGRGVLPVLYKTLNTGGVTNVSLNPWIFGGAAVFSLLVVYISCIKPCRLATRVSPIEAVRFVEQSQYKKKTKKTGSINMFTMAAANMGRSKKKAIAVIASLSLSLILINTTYSLIKSFSFDSYVKSYLVSDFMLSHYSTVNMMAEAVKHDAITPEIISYLEGVDGVEGVHTFPTSMADIILSEAARKEFDSYIHNEGADEGNSRWAKNDIENILNTGLSQGNVYGMDSDTLEYLDIWKGSLDTEKFVQGGYALISADSKEKNWVLPGDTITVKGQDGTQQELQVMAVVKLPYGLSTRMYPGLFPTETIISKKDYDQLFQSSGGLNASIDAAKGKEAQVGDALEDYISSSQPDLVLSSKETLKQEFSKEISMFSVIGGLLGFILALIGILNLINATITSILSRKQEFAMMQAVGMTGKQLERLLIHEGLLYGAGTLFTALTLGNVVSYGFIYMIGRNMAYFEWNFTIAPILLSIPVIALISVALPVICYQVFCRKSIIERLRMAEV